MLASALNRGGQLVVLDFLASESSGKIFSSLVYIVLTYPDQVEDNQFIENEAAKTHGVHHKKGVLSLDSSMNQLILGHAGFTSEEMKKLFSRHFVYSEAGVSQLSMLRFHADIVLSHPCPFQNLTLRNLRAEKCLRRY